MSQQIPDRWVILNIQDQQGREFKVILAGEYGGYLGSDSWRRSSPIASIITDEDKHIVTTESGTEYVLHISQRGFTNLMSNIYDTMTNVTEKLGIKLSVVEEL